MSVCCTPHKIDDVPTGNAICISHEKYNVCGMCCDSLIMLRSVKGVISYTANPPEYLSNVIEIFIDFFLHILKMLVVPMLLYQIFKKCFINA